MSKWRKTDALVVLASAPSISVVPHCASLDCDFQNGLCGWEADSNENKFQWERRSQEMLEDEGHFGPAFDRHGSTHGDTY
jgi:hypothetical protein